MQFRPLGRTGLQVSSVGFGAWGLAGELWQGVDPADAEAALVAALDAGCTFIDTALIYGPGVSERVIGRVLRGRPDRDRVVVASKIPPLDRRWPPDPAVPLAAVFPPAHVVRSVDESLGNLGLDALPLEQLHVWLDRWLDDPTWPDLERAMADLVRAGKVRHWGISANDHAPDTALAALDHPLLETVQVIYNIFDRSPERALLPRAAERQTGVIARVPFDEGALVGAVTASSAFDPRDFRSRYFRGERAAQAAERAERLRPLLGKEAATLAELALRFCLSRPEVSTVIPGARRAAHARANLVAGDGRPLSPGLLAQLAGHAWDKNWYDW
ncbi:MAG TPA: aldo/keto reductase [Kofleriaceae bacterium]|nr:aldo/keto reductase [Kofleriaceae bacterium]